MPNVLSRSVRAVFVTPEKVYTAIGFAIGLIWFLILQFYWFPTPELTDLILISFFWPCVVLLVSLMVVGVKNFFHEWYGTPYVTIGAAFGLVWFISLQFYWPPAPNLLDDITSAFFWPVMISLVVLTAMGLIRLQAEVRYYRLKRATHSERFAKQVYFALRRDADLSDTDFDIYTIEEVQAALIDAHTKYRK